MSNENEKNKPPVRVLEVKEILDKRTLVIGGSEIARVGLGADLSVIAIGPTSERVGAPIVVEKAHVVVTQHSGVYVIAQAPARKVTTYKSQFTSIADLVRGEEIVKEVHDPLTVEETAMIGNPATRPIRIGDHVIDRHDFPELVKWLAEGNKLD